MKASIVAIFGWIIPEPFAQPRSRTFFPSMRQRAAAHFGRVSVVMIARANSSKARCLGAARRARVRDGGENFFDAQRRADHARGADQELRRIDAASSSASFEAVATEAG